MKALADTVELQGAVTFENVRDCLVGGVNLAWENNGENARLHTYANFVALMIQEYDRRTREFEAMAADLARLAAENLKQARELEAYYESDCEHCPGCDGDHL